MHGPNSGTGRIATYNHSVSVSLNCDENMNDLYLIFPPLTDPDTQAAYNQLLDMGCKHRETNKTQVQVKNHIH